jgi:hypothetical protein
MKQEDALERLMQRQRPSVPLRAQGLEAEIASAEVRSIHTDARESDHLNGNGAVYADVNESVSQGEKVSEPKRVRTTTRLDAEVDKGLRTLCMDERITKEVWFEAAYLYLAEHPEAMTAVVGMARERYQYRKRAAEWKKLATMQKRLQGD